MHLKYARQPVDNFLQKCKKIYEEWKATVGYAHDCLDVNSTSIKESREPFPGFNNLKNAYEERLKQIAAHKMERLNIFAKHSADDGAHHHNITTANLNETKEEEKQFKAINKVIEAIAAAEEVLPTGVYKQSIEHAFKGWIKAELRNNRLVFNYNVISERKRIERRTKLLDGVVSS